MPILNLADHTLSLLGYIANYGIETRDASFFVNQPLQNYGRRGRGRRFCHPAMAIVTRVVFAIAISVYILGLALMSVSFRGRYGMSCVNVLSGLRSLNVALVFFQLYQKLTDLKKLARKFKEFSIDDNQKKATRFQNWPVWAALAYYFVWFFRYYVMILSGNSRYFRGNEFLAYIFSWIASLFIGWACFMPAVVCMIIYSVSGYVRIRIQNQLCKLKAKKSTQEKLNMLKTIVDEDYEALRSLATDTDRIIGPIIGSIRLVLVVQLFILFKVWSFSNVITKGIIADEVGFAFVSGLAYYLHIKSAIKTNEMLRQLPKTICKMLVEMGSLEFLEASNAETPSEESPTDQANTVENPTKLAISVINPVEQEIVVPVNYFEGPVPHSVYGAIVPTDVNEDGMLRQDQFFDATKMLSLNLSLLTCVTHLHLEKGWFRINGYPIDGKEFLQLWYQWNRMDLMAGRAFMYSSMMYADF